MGTWGAGLFADDSAGDVRDDFRDAIAEGLTAAAATDRVLAQYAPDRADRPYAARVWLALAVTQWKLGRLEARVRAAALAAIDSGEALEAWLGGKDEARRRRILAAARAQLVSPAPAPRKARRDPPSVCDWPPGELVAYRTLGGDQIILQIQMLHSDKGGTYPSLEVLDWRGAAIPAAEVIDALPFARATPAYLASLHRSFATTPDLEVRMSRIMLLGLKPHTQKGRFRPLGLRHLPPEKRWPVSGNAVLLKNFDDYLARVLGFG